MTRQDFIKLIDGGFITVVGVADKFLNDEKLLSELTLEKLYEMGVVTKQVCIEFEEESVIAEVTEEPVTTIEPVTVTEEPVKKSSKKVDVTEEPVTTIEPVTEAPVDDIVVDEGEDE